MILSGNIRSYISLRQSELKLTSLVGLFLTVIAIIVMTQNYFKYAYLGNYSFGMSLAYNLIVYSTYALLTPLIFHLGQKFSIKEAPRTQRLLLHLALSVLFGLGHMIFCNVVLFSVDLSSSIIFPRFIAKYLTNVIHFHLLAYWAILLLMTFRSRKQEPQKKEKIVETLERFRVDKNGRTFFVELDQVYWIEAMDHYQKIHTDAGYHVIKDVMKSLQEKLPSEHFIRIHRSYFANRKMIKALHKNSDLTVILKNGETLKVGNSYKKAVLSLFD